MRHKTVRSASLLVVVLALTSRAAGAEDTVTVEGAVVPVATGWVQSNNGNTVVLTPSDLPKGVICSLSLVGGGTLEGSLKDCIDAEWKGYEKLGRITEDQGSKIDGAGKPVEIASRVGRIEMKDQQVIYDAWLIIAHANGRVEKMIFLSSTAEAFRQYAPAVSQMVNGTSYVVPQPKKPIPIAALPSEPKWNGKPPAPLEGVCFGTVKTVNEEHLECWIFRADGTAYHGLPIGGPAHLDLDAERQRKQASVGKYQADGEEIVATMEGQKTPIRLKKSDGVWRGSDTRVHYVLQVVYGGNNYLEAQFVMSPFFLNRAESCDNLKLAGTYRLGVDPKSYAPKPVPTIRFTADGEFTDDRMVKTIEPRLSDDKGKTVESKTPAGGHGKYSIAKNTVELEYSGGVKVSMTFLATAEELAKPMPQVVYLNDSTLVLLP